MNDDLISRKALKKELDNIKQTEYAVKDKQPLFEYVELPDLIKVIDNAQPVDEKPFALVSFSKEELNRIVEERVIEPIKNGELVIKEKRPHGEWIPVSERLPEGKIDPMTNDFELVLCSTVWEVVRPYKFGKPIGHSKAHFWSGGGIMDDYVIAWKPMPEPYKEETDNAEI